MSDYVGREINPDLERVALAADEAARWGRDMALTSGAVAMFDRFAATIRASLVHPDPPDTAAGLTDAD